ncbi:hypothetical protein B0H13DRAFT_2375195 [Mycena leptocephala]|nr:hypothetical protein B0H13DRAFT_2375195 [Mycena leptocephala]
MAASSRWRAAYDARAAVALSSDRLHHDQCRRPYLLAHNLRRVWAHPQNIHRWPHTYHLCCLPAHRDRLRLDALPGLSSTQKRPHTSDDQLARTGRTTHSTTVNPSPSPALSLYLIAIQPQPLSARRHRVSILGAVF